MQLVVVYFICNRFFNQGAANMKAVALENYCRQLQNALRQQHAYAEALMQRKFFD